MGELGTATFKRHGFHQVRRGVTRKFTKWALTEGRGAPIQGEPVFVSDTGTRYWWDSVNQQLEADRTDSREQ